MEENPYLELFYQDMSKYAFQLQVHLLTARFSQQQRIVWSERGAVQDRSIYEDAVFAQMLEQAGHISALDAATYRKLFGQMSRFMSRPTALVYLDLSPEESLERIRLRARGCEVGITLEYLTALHGHYEDFIREISISVPVIRVKYDRFYSSDKVADAVLTELSKLGTIRSIEIQEDAAPTALEVSRALDAAEAASGAATGGEAGAATVSAAGLDKPGTSTAAPQATPSPTRQDPTPPCTASPASPLSEELRGSAASDLSASMEAAQS